MDNSPLARLPAELRNDIYELALRQEEPVIIDGCDKHAAVIPPRAMGITQTRKDIRAETAGVFYALNTFTVRHPTSSFAGFLDSIGQSSTKAMRSIVLDGGVACYETWGEKYLKDKERMKTSCSRLNGRCATLTRYDIAIEQLLILEQLEGFVVEIDERVVASSMEDIKRRAAVRQSVSRYYGERQSCSVIIAQADDLREGEGSGLLS